MHPFVKLARWYQTLNKIQKFLANVFAVMLAWAFIATVTHEPRERKPVTKIILNCNTCGVDPARTITYNEYMDQKEQQQKTWFREAKQQIQQDAWNEKGRQRWCDNHPQDRNCR